jgi:hypothetical protein
MPRESELVEPIVRWILNTFRNGNRLLIHEEPQGHHAGRPDILVVFGSTESDSVDRVTTVPIEIERTSHAAIHDRRNGLSQLRRYAGHAKYLAIPRTVAIRREAREIPSRCAKHGVGLLVVDLENGDVGCRVDPEWSVPVRGLRSYPVAMKRWIGLRNSAHTYRRISGRVIIDED